LYDMVHRYMWDNGHGLTIHVKSIVKCVRGCDIWALDLMIIL
jgi:hypothetical protein